MACYAAFERPYLTQLWHRPSLCSDFFPNSSTFYPQIIIISDRFNLYIHKQIDSIAETWCIMRSKVQLTNMCYVFKVLCSVQHTFLYKPQLKN